MKLGHSIRNNFRLTYILFLIVFLIHHIGDAKGTADSILVFNEIHYNPANGNSNSEWIEFHNLNGVNVDISGWKLRGGVDFDFPEGTVKDDGWVGFRIPNLEFTRDLIRIIKKPVTGTSANISNFPETKDLGILKNSLNEKNIGKFVDINCGPEDLPSTVLKLDKNKIKIIREGPISKSLIKSTLGDDFKYE